MGLICSKNELLSGTMRCPNAHLPLTSSCIILCIFKDTIHRHKSVLNGFENKEVNKIR